MDAEMNRGATAPDTSSRSRRRTALIMLMGLVIFASGAVVGIGSTILFLHYKMTRMRRNPHAMHREFAERIRDRLDLTEEQTRRVETILREHHEQLMTLHREMHPRLESSFEQMRADVADVLTPQQASRWSRDFHAIFPMGPPRSNGMPPPPPPGGMPFPPPREAPPTPPE